MKIRGGVDVEHVRRSDRRDQDPGEGRPEEGHRALRSLDDRVRLPDGPLVVADELRQDQPLRREVGREEAADGEDEDEQERKRQGACLVEKRNREHQRGACRVADDHRRARPEPRDQRPARDPQQRHGQDLDREDDRPSSSPTPS